MHRIKTTHAARWLSFLLTVCMAIAPFCSACCRVSPVPNANSADDGESSCHHHQAPAGSVAWNDGNARRHCESAETALEPLSPTTLFHTSREIPSDLVLSCLGHWHRAAWLSVAGRPGSPGSTRGRRPPGSRNQRAGARGIPQPNMPRPRKIATCPTGHIECNTLVLR